MKYRPLTEAEVTFTFEQESEDIPVRGNAICSDDEEFDKKAEDEIIERLDRNAWFCAKVTAEWKGWKESAYLGGCSYGPSDNPEAELLADLKGEALSNLNGTLESEAMTLAERLEIE
jgi:hypothetical protein